MNAIDFTNMTKEKMENPTRVDRHWLSEVKSDDLTTLLLSLGLACNGSEDDAELSVFHDLLDAVRIELKIRQNKA